MHPMSHPFHLVFYRVEQSFVRKLTCLMDKVDYSIHCVDSQQEIDGLLDCGTPLDLMFFQTPLGEDTSALDVCQALKSRLPLVGGIKIFVGGRPTTEILDRGQAAGISDWFRVPFSKEEIRTRLMILCEARRYQIDMENRVRQAMADILLARDTTIEAIAALVECRDGITGKHARRTRSYLGVLIEEVKRLGHFPEELTAEYQELIVKTSPLHDIGKVGIRDDILLKPDDLTEEERREMKTHTTKGGEALLLAAGRTTNSPFLQCAHAMATYHHEHWDGQGYPTGLRGKDIPLCARLMAVADVYDALRQDRPYRPAWTHDRSVSHIAERAGTEFDPFIVTAFLNVAGAFEKISARHNSTN